MSYPRQVLPGSTLMVSRRCAQRQFLLRPGPRINQIFQFCLSVAAERSGVQIHGFCVQSNHFHVVLTDPSGTLPCFMHWLDTYVAKCINAHLGRWESFWAPGSYSAVRALDREAVIDRLVYTWSNPVTAGLVRTARDWPGARTLPRDLEAEPRRIARPKGFFRQRGSVPEHTTLRLVLPPVFAGQPVQVVREQLERRLSQREREVQGEMRRQGRSFLGVRRVLALSPYHSPARPEPRRGLNPRVSSRDPQRRVEELGRVKTFLLAYRQALKRWIAGDKNVAFPPGTYYMRVFFGVAIHQGMTATPS